jgi:ACS family tartrate transporter-like MFS transporter
MSEQQVFAKCAWRLIPFMGLLLLVNSIDRTNVGFAALTMNKDLGFSPTVFGLGAGVFFIGYALFQVPANVLLQRIGARRWVFCILAMWSVLSTLNAFVQSPMSFYAVRFFLGVAEAGFFSGMLLYLTYWFPRTLLAHYTAYFTLAVPLSFVVGGPLASLFLGFDGVAGIHGWQWLFFIEGAPGFLLAFAVLKFLPDGPVYASWLAAGEKHSIALYLAAAEPQGSPNLWSALRDPRVLAMGISNFAVQGAGYGVVLWLPQMAQAMGFSSRATGFIVSLCFVAGIPAMIFGGRSSSRTGERIWHVALPWLLGALGFAVAGVAQANAIVFLALAFGLIGLFAAYGAFLSLPSSFLRGDAAAGGIALFGTFGNIGGFFGPVLFGVLKQSSGFYASSMLAVALGFALASFIVLAVGRALATHSKIQLA